MRRNTVLQYLAKLLAKQASCKQTTAYQQPTEEQQQRQANKGEAAVTTGQRRRRSSSNRPTVTFNPKKNKLKNYS